LCSKLDGEVKRLALLSEALGKVCVELESGTTRDRERQLEEV
jgi:hypothetical protein